MSPSAASMFRWSSLVLTTRSLCDSGFRRLTRYPQLPSAVDVVCLQLQDAIPTSMWALSMGDRVFGPLLLLDTFLHSVDCRFGTGRHLIVASS